MNRRNMLRSLATILGASCSPGLFIPKFEPVRWKVVKPQLSFQYGDATMLPPANCYYGKWQFVSGPDCSFDSFIVPLPKVWDEVVMHVRGA